ncbi:hypothetical protein RFI_36766 [Reticulomyxa filosa]|uniref:Uncharacterized protein n=1 Tax=Reticulomyxa filosa TaxID=46433 RepID=X6LGF9_RETFI|nr:hypothetical protein RFI_36766 [Reticulomyxa filosa]|eukprot:ETO00674.1 hypothetical protein RFI_36766 [Reticulomyxa filosa]
MSTIPLESVITEVQKMTNCVSKKRVQVFDFKKKIGTILRKKKSPCISDMTLQMNKKLMPVIREPNYSDKTWDMSMDKMVIVVGNEKKDQALKSIPLKEYLESFDNDVCARSNKQQVSTLNLTRLICIYINNLHDINIYIWTHFQMNNLEYVGQSMKEKSYKNEGIVI